MKDPLISVYTPTYNRANLLKDRAIKSVLDQTYKNFEYIIVSDGSTDNTKEVVEAIEDPRIRFYEIKRKRPHHNYDSKKDWFISASYPANFALGKITGEWIAKIDDDDIWTKDHLEKLLRFAQEGNYEFVSGQYVYEKQGEYNLFNGIYLKSPYFYPKIKYINLDSPKLGGHSTFFYRSYLNKFKYNPKAYKKKNNKVDIYDLAVRMYEKRVRMGFLEETTLYVLPRPNENAIGFEAIENKIEVK
jgi:glycosyltransferase involved in cell wall biosynthesis